jgi:hypothetical protein
MVDVPVSAREIARWTMPDARQFVIAAGTLRPAGGVLRVSARDGQRVRVHTLFPAGTGPTTSFPAPGPDDGFAVSSDGTFAVFTSTTAVTAVAADGSRRWLHAYPRPVRDGSHGSTLITAEGRQVWTVVPADATTAGSRDDDARLRRTDQWLVLDAADGSVLAATTLDSVGAGSEHFAHPDGIHIGLSVGEGQDGALLYWGRLDGGNLIWWSVGDSDRVLVDLNSDGSRFLTVAHGQEDAAIHAFGDRGGDPLARIPAGPGPVGDQEFDDPDGPYWDFVGGFVDDATVLLSRVELEEAELAGHWLFDGVTGASYGEIVYPAPITGYARPLGEGTWLTADDDHLYRWQREPDG